MSNVVGTQVIVVDTAGATPIVTVRKNVIGVMWFGATAVDDAVVMKDRNGNLFFEDKVFDIGTANNALMQGRPPLNFSVPVPIDGIIVSTLTAGTKLYIYLCE